MTDPTPFGTALHDRVRDEHPDLDELVRTATRSGARIRRVRRTGAAVAAVAGVAVVAVGAAALQGPDTPAGGGVPIATQPTTAPSTTPQPGESAPSTDEADLRVTLERLAEAKHRQSLAPGAPVYVTAPGWECTAPADEKYSCSNDGRSVAVNWRPAEDRASYLDPDKADVVPGVHTFVSPARGRWFATVAPVEGTTQAQVDSVGASLVWVRN